MSTVDTKDLHWWKSRRSDSQGGECVEVAGDGVRWFVRDSKDRGGGMLAVSGTAWQPFLTHLRSRSLGRRP
jgi:hypothetical protein